jgi:hypothetical protein
MAPDCANIRAIPAFLQGKSAQLAAERPAPTASLPDLDEATFIQMAGDAKKELPSLKSPQR